MDEFNIHAAIWRLVAIAEGFSLTKLIDVTEAKLPRDPMVDALWYAEQDRSTDTWDSRDRLWQSLHRVDTSEFADANPLDGFIEARNTITHGLGQLTRKQLSRRQKTVSRLAHAQIPLHGDRIIVTEQHVERCATVVKAYIRWLDARG